MVRLGKGWSVLVQSKNMTRFFSPDGEVYTSEAAAMQKCAELRKHDLMGWRVMQELKDDTKRMQGDDGCTSGAVTALQLEQYQNRGKILEELPLYIYSMWVSSLISRQPNSVTAKTVRAERVTAKQASQKQG